MANGDFVAGNTVPARLMSAPRVSVNASPGFYLTYPDGSIAYPQTFKSEKLAEIKRAELGFNDWKIKRVVA